MVGVRSQEYDVVVVGGGPIGAVAARVAALAGVSVLVAEEHSRPGLPVQCAGLVSPRALEEAGVGRAAVEREIASAVIRFPNDRVFHICAEEAKAYVIDREALDCELVSQAAKAGAEIWLGAKVIGIEKGPKGSTTSVVVRENGRKHNGATKITARVLIGADGPHSLVRQWARLPAPQAFLYGLQAVASHWAEREDAVELLLGNTVAPGFFAWLIPASRGVARLGLATSKRAEVRPLLERLLKQRGVKANQLIEIQAGVIPIGFLSRTVQGNSLVVGDAAGQVKPISGGGLYTGIVCAKLAGQAAAQAVLSGSATVLQNYEQQWRKCLERELRLGLVARKWFEQLNDSQLDRLADVLDNPQLRRLIAIHGDIDYPSRLVRHLLGKPAVWQRLLPLVDAISLQNVTKALV